MVKTIQRFSRTGSTLNRPRHGRPKKLSARAQCHIQRLCLGNRCMCAASIAAEVEGVGGQPVSAQTICRTLHQIGLHGCRPRRKHLLNMHKKASKQFAEDKFVLPTVKHGGGSVMVWGFMRAVGTGELQFIEGTINANMCCNILKQSMIPSIRRLGRRAVLQHDNNYCLAKEAEGKGYGLAKHVSRSKPY